MTGPPRPRCPFCGGRLVKVDETDRHGGACFAVGAHQHGKPYYRAPLRNCRECGDAVRTWQVDPVCSPCRRDAAGRQGESFRATRLRIPSIAETLENARRKEEA